MPATAKKPCIGAVIKAARLRRKLSADEVAKQCNVSRSRVYMWEADTYIFPKNLPTLAEVLHIPIKQLKAVNGQPHRV